MDRIDYRDNYRECYAPQTAEAHWVDLPRMNVLAIDGDGPTAESAERLARLADAVRLAVRRRMHVDFAPMPVETLRYPDGRWTLLVMQPPFVYADTVATAGGEGVRFASLGEGRAAQCTATVGGEAAAAEALRAWARSAGTAVEGLVHTVPLDGVRCVVRIAAADPDWAPPRPGYL